MHLTKYCNIFEFQESCNYLPNSKKKRKKKSSIIIFDVDYKSESKEIAKSD